MHSASFGEGRWREYTFDEQMGNIGSEVSRALHWKGKNEQAFEGAIARALELLDFGHAIPGQSRPWLDFTIQDARWKHRLKELVRARELIADALYEGKEYGTTFEYLDQYFLQYARAARKDR